MSYRIKNTAAALGWLLLFLAAQMGAGMVYLFARIFALFSAAGSAGASDTAAIIQQASNDLLTNVMPVMLGSYLLLAAAACLIFLLRRRSPLRECCLVPAPARAFALPVGAGFGLYAAVNLLLLVAPLPEAWMAALGEYSSELTGSGLALYLIGAVFITPAVEEIVFRGLVYTRLRRAMPLLPAMLIAAAVFGAVHLSGSPILVLPAVILGILTCAALEKTGSLLPCIAAHFAANLTSVLQGFFQGLPAGVVYAAAAGCGALFVYCFVRLLRAPRTGRGLAVEGPPAPAAAPADGPRYCPRGM